MSASFPITAWDGKSASRPVAPTVELREPNADDYRRMYEEILAMQQPDVGSSPAVVGLSKTNLAQPIVKTTLSFSNMVVNMTDAGVAGCHGSQKLFDFPQGNILILGATTDVQVLAGAGGIVDTAALVAAVGSVQVGTGDATLTTTEANIVPSIAATLATGAGNADGESTVAVTLDGTATPAAAHLNFAVPDAGSTANDTLTVNGTVTLTWVNLGDN